MTLLLAPWYIILLRRITIWITSLIGIINDWICIRIDIFRFEALFLRFFPFLLLNHLFILVFDCFTLIFRRSCKLNTLVIVIVSYYNVLNDNRLVLEHTLGLISTYFNRFLMILGICSVIILEIDKLLRNYVSCFGESYA